MLMVLLDLAGGEQHLVKPAVNTVVHVDVLTRGKPFELVEPLQGGVHLRMPGALHSRLLIRMPGGQMIRSAVFVLHVP